MLNIASNDLRTLVLIKLTKSIIENSETYAMFKLKKMLSSKEIESISDKKTRLEEFKIKKIRKTRETKKERIKEKVKEKLNYAPSIMDPKEVSQSFFVPTKKDIFKTKVPPQVRRQLTPEMNQPQGRPLQRMRVSGDDLPEHLRYLRPTRTDVPKQLELGKLIPFLNDKNVKSIEVEGSDQPIYVKGTMGKKTTGVIITADEINQILNTFSKVGKVPKVEGLFKVVASNLVLTAMVSESIGSRFIIKKM